MKPGCAKFDFGKCDETGAVPDFVDFTTDEYSFVIKCTASRHLPVRRKTPPPCRGGGSKSRRGFPPTYHSARETKGSLRPSAWRTKRPLWPPQGKQKGRYDPPYGEQNGHYGRREGNKRALWPPQGKQTAIMAAARRTEGSLRPRGCETPSPLRGSSSSEVGQFFPSQ